MPCGATVLAQQGVMATIRQKLQPRYIFNRVECLTLLSTQL